MRKHVKPADSAATIPDPSRGGVLPPEGLPVAWNAHWARLEMRGDVVVSEIEEAAAEPVPETAPDAPEPEPRDEAQDQPPALEAPPPEAEAPATARRARGRA